MKVLSSIASLMAAVVVWPHARYFYLRVRKGKEAADNYWRLRHYDLACNGASG